MDYSALISLVLGRMGMFGILLLLFGAGIDLAAVSGARIPQLVAEWTSVLIVLGVVLIIMAVASSAINLCGRLVHRLLQRREVASERAATS